jgi:hypothetical protein
LSRFKLGEKTVFYTSPKTIAPMNAKAATMASKSIV